MPSEPRRLHGFTIVSRAIRLARRLILPAILGGASVGDGFGNVFFWVVLILSLPSILVAAAQWLVFRYRLEADELIIDSGVLARRKRVIPIDRIQNVDLEQSALERMAGVAELRIETASGGRETEAGLTVLAVADARALQTELLRRRAAVRGRPGSERAADGDAHAAEPLLRLSAADLALAGATSNEAGLIAAGLATLLEVGMRFGALEGIGARVDDAIAAGTGIGWMGALTAITLLALLFLVLGWVVSIAASIVRFHGFTLARAGDDLRREYGLLTRHHATVPLERVQAVRVEETLLRRALGLATLKIETAGAGPQEQRGYGGGAEAYVPIARRRDVGALLREVFPDARFDDVRLETVAPLSRRRDFIRISLLVLAAAAALGAVVEPGLLLLVALVGPGWILAGARYNARGWARAGGYVLARNGVLTRTTWVVPDRKIQTLHVRETPFQRRWALATLLVDTAAAGRAASVIDLHRHTATALLADLARDADAARIRAANLHP